MPSPVGHSLMAYIFYRTSLRPVQLRQWQVGALYLFTANAPDLDFLPGLIVGNLSRYHHGPSHSLAFAILFGVVVSLFCSRRLCTFIVASSLYSSHVVLDYLVQDPSPPHGVPLLWPLTYEYFMASFAFFPRFDYLARSTEPMFTAVLTLYNLSTIAIEIVLLSPLIVLVEIWSRIRGSRKNVVQA
jgi:inner membrane protein